MHSPQHNPSLALFVAALAVFGFVKPHSGLAYSGTDPVPVDDGKERACIDARYDRISLMLARLVVNKPKLEWAEKWIAHPSGTDVLIDTAINYQQGGINKDVTTPIALPIKMQGNESGAIALPVRYRLVTQLKLQTNTPPWQGIPTAYKVLAADIRFSFLDMSRPTLAATIVKRIADSSKEAPIGPGAYEGVKYFSSLVNGIVDDVVKESQSGDPTIHDGATTFEFRDTGDCGRTGATSGPYALITAPTDPTDHEQLSLDQLNNFCFYTEAQTDSVMYMPKPPSSTCPPLKQAGATKKLVNPHYVFLLDAERDYTGNPATNSKAGIKRERRPRPRADAEQLALKRLASAHAGFLDHLEDTKDEPDQISLVYRRQSVDSVLQHGYVMDYAGERKIDLPSGTLLAEKIPSDDRVSVVKVAKDSAEYSSALVAAERCLAFQIPSDQCS